jgi:hypothetical protein
VALPLPRVPDERQADCYAAGAAPRPHFQDHTRKALTRRGYGGWRGDGDNLSNIDFCGSAGFGCHSRASGNRSFRPQWRASACPQWATAAIVRRTSRKTGGRTVAKSFGYGALFALAAMSSVQAQMIVDVAKITCKQFITYEITDARTLSLWLGRARQVD